jgi:hypothetical protein
VYENVLHMDNNSCIYVFVYIFFIPFYGYMHLHVCIFLYIIFIYIILHIHISSSITVTGQGVVKGVGSARARAKGVPPSASPLGQSASAGALGTVKRPLGIICRIIFFTYAILAGLHYSCRE